MQVRVRWKDQVLRDAFRGKRRVERGRRGGGRGEGRGRGVIGQLRKKALWRFKTRREGARGGRRGRGRMVETYMTGKVLAAEVGAGAEGAGEGRAGGEMGG